jgi:hypothetical protein
VARDVAVADQEGSRRQRGDAAADKIEVALLVGIGIGQSRLYC